MTTEPLSFAESIFGPSCRTAVLIACLFLLRYFLGNRLSPAWRHALWGLVPLALLPMISIPSSLSIYNLLPQTESATEYGVGIGGGIGPDTSRPTEIVPAELAATHHIAIPEHPSPKGGVLHTGWQTIFTAMWLFGCVTMALLFLRQTALCRRWIAKGNPVRNERVLTIFESCRRQMNVKTWLVVAESTAVSGPFLIGAIRPTLLLPHGMVESASEQQLRAVFLHELAHLKRWDVWTGWLMTLLLIVHWFNPLLWLAIRRMNADREEACDAAALETLNQSDRRDYARSLLDITERYVVPDKFSLQTPGLVGISETGKFLTRRIDMLKQMGTWKLRWKVLALAAAFFICAATLTDAQEKKPKKSAAEIQKKIDKLQTELQKAKDAEAKPEIAECAQIVQAYPLTEEPKVIFDELQKRIVGSRDVILSLDADSNTLLVLGHKADHEKVKETLARLRKGIAEGRKSIQEESPVMTNARFAMAALAGRYLGMEGDDRVGMEIGQPKNGIYPIAIYEGGLPENGYDPKDDGKYVGTANFNMNTDSGRMWSTITLKQKFDGSHEEAVEPALRGLTASIEVKAENNGIAFKLTIPKNKEWDEIRLEKIIPLPPSQPTIVYLKDGETVQGGIKRLSEKLLAGRYLGREGDDKMGMILTPSKDGAEQYGVVFYEDGLPGTGHDPNDDEHYEGIATLKDGTLEIHLMKKFDEGREERVEKALQKLTANVDVDKEGNAKIDISRNAEWDAVRLTRHKHEK